MEGQRWTRKDGEEQGRTGKDEERQGRTRKDREEPFRTTKDRDVFANIGKVLNVHLFNRCLTGEDGGILRYFIRRLLRPYT